MRSLLAPTLFLLPALPATAADLSLIVDRSERGVEIFVKLPTDRTEALLAPFPEGFVDADGLINIEPFRAGTFRQGDVLWSKVETVIGEETALVEAMSMMVHPDELPVDFNDPIDGWIAMAVCNVTEENARYDPEVLSTYAGFFAWEVDGHGPVHITFPQDMEIEVTEFLEGREIASLTIQTGPDDPLALDAVTTWERIRFW
ncbi:MAG: hypothetical protein AAGF13_04290 [Pseudomonadota bacterium]